MSSPEEQDANAPVKPAQGRHLRHTVLPGFMGGDFAQRLVASATGEPELLEPALVTSPQEKRALQSGVRRSWQVSGRDALLAELEGRIRQQLPSLCSAVGLAAPDKPFIDSELSVYRNGDFFGPHVDVFTEEKRAFATYDRELTAVYYAHRQPRAFTGGELVLHPLFGVGEPVEIAPDHDTLVVFPSFTPHEVRPVMLPGDALGDARVSVNCWVGRRR